MSERFKSLADQIRRGEPISPPIAFLLSAASLGQRVGMQLRLRAPRTRIDARVISFGNLTAGGTGKTPAVIERAAQEASAGVRVAVLTRGYGSASSYEPCCIPPDESTPNRYQQAGDEAALIALRVPGVWIIKAADRVAGARAAFYECGCSTLLLDDGYQAVALERDKNILLIDARNPFGNRRILPRGILREPVRAIARATEIVLTRCDEAKNLDALIAEIKALRPGISIRRTRHAATGLWRVASGEQLGLDFLQKREVAIACGIAHPETFRATIEGLGASVKSSHYAADHAPLPADAFDSPLPVIVTEKDAVRLQAPAENIYALRIELRDC